MFGFQVSEKIVNCYLLCQKEQFDDLEKLLTDFPKVDLRQCRVQEAHETDDEDEEVRTNNYCY